MKNLHILLVIGLILMSNIIIAQNSKLVKIHQYNNKTEQGYIHSLNEDTITLSRTLSTNAKSQLLLHHYPVENVHSVSIRMKEDLRAIGIIGGAVLGAVPGILIINDIKNYNGFEALLAGPFQLAIGFSVGLVGSIGGAILGAVLTKPKFQNIDIFGQKDIYNKNMENIRKYAY